MFNGQAEFPASVEHVLGVKQVVDLEGRRLRTLARLVVVSLAMTEPLVAGAVPAVVRTFDAAARSGPSGAATTATTFPRLTQLDVSAGANNGFRMVRLADGSDAWVEEWCLDLPPVAAPAPIPLPPPPGPPPASAEPRSAPAVRTETTAAPVAAVALATAKPTEQVPPVEKPKRAPATAPAFPSCAAAQVLAGTPLRLGPSAEAAVKVTLTIQSEACAVPEVRFGFRRVKLKDGTTGYAPESSIIEGQ